MTPLLLASFLALIADGPELEGKVVCGYQGWFRADGDGTGLGWQHYTEGPAFEPGRCSIDLWPDVRELPAPERFATPFRHPDGTPAEVFSSARPAVVSLHFRWMREYGIDGVFLQRFAGAARDDRQRPSMDAVLSSCRASAAESGRAWALMYDLSGVRRNLADSVINDWKHLDASLGFRQARSEESYLRHRGRPVVGLWGLGFNDRPANLDDWRRLISFLRDDPEHGGCSIVLGVPAYWRTLDRDSIADPALLEVIASADVVCPWTVGRYSTPDQARDYASRTLSPDLAWCRDRGLSLLPVCFPGFSWRNLMAGRGQRAKLDQIPRLRGDFLRSQFTSDTQAGATMLYVAMFDELDEGTAIFKVRQDPPDSADSRFVSEPDVPGDLYLRLTGEAGRLLQRP